MDNSQPALPVYHRKIANPAPLGKFHGLRSRNGSNLTTNCRIERFRTDDVRVESH